MSRKVFNDPDRWVDADMNRNSHLRWFFIRLAIAVVGTAAVIVIGVMK